MIAGVLDGAGDDDWSTRGYRRYIQRRNVRRFFRIVLHLQEHRNVRCEHDVEVLAGDGQCMNVDVRIATGLDITGYGELGIDRLARPGCETERRVVDAGNE